MGLRDEVLAELKQHIIPFWEKLKDNEYGGYYGYMDFDLKVDKHYEKGCILNSRILWFFSSAYTLTGDDELLRCADHAWEFMNKYCVDKENGGIFWSVTYDGDVLDSTKHTYNQAFAIYALSAYYEASGCKAALELADNLFERIEDTCTDQYGYLEAFTIDWNPESNEKLSENGLLADKTMNTLLHVLEAYTELYRVAKEDRVATALKRILNEFKDKVYNDETGHLEVFFDAKMNTISDLYSYGHDIEASWLLDRACKVLDDEETTEKMRNVILTIADNVYKIAYDGKAMNNECFKGEVDTTRVWWVQAEAIVGFYNCYQLTGDEKYLQIADKLWEYIKEYVIDKRSGSEWFWDLNASNEPESRKPIVEPWKCPYHNGRMCMEIIRRTNK